MYSIGKTRSPGFTMVELLVVMAIIGILGALSSMLFRSPKEKAVDVQSLVTMHQVGAFLDQEKLASVANAYPTIAALTDSDSWTALLAAIPAGQAAQLPAADQGFAAAAVASSYCLWKAALVTPGNFIYCTSGPHCSEKEGVAAASLPAGCSH